MVGVLEKRLTKESSKRILYSLDKPKGVAIGASISHYRETIIIDIKRTIRLENKEEERKAEIVLRQDFTIKPNEYTEEQFEELLNLNLKELENPNPFNWVGVTDGQG